MTRTELLRALERLTHAERMRRMVELGRQAGDDPTVATALDQLERGDFYERYLALQACYGSRDGAHALRALSDPSRGLRTFAATLVPQLCDDAQIASALAVVGRGQRSLLLRQLQKRHRQATIDAHIERRASATDPVLDRALPFASAPIVERALPAVAERMERETWRRLARRHPAFAETTIVHALAVSGPVNARLLWQANGVLVGLGERDPHRAFALAAVLAGRTALDRLELGPLTKRRPVDFVRLTLATGDLAPSGELGRRFTDPFARAVAQCTDEELVTLLDRGFLTTNTQPNNWFRRLPPARRATLYMRLRAGGHGWSVIDSPAILTLGPRPAREVDARRQFDRPGLPTEPGIQLRFASVLPWEEMIAALTPSLIAPRTRWRSAALAALVDAVRFSRDQALDMLALLHERRNEQDPVRQGFLRALADLPPGLWRAEHLPHLATTVRDALDAADLSGASATALEALLVRLLPFHAEWAAAELAVLAREQGRLWEGQAHACLTDAAVVTLERHLAPVLSSWAEQGNDAALVALATSLGPRLPACTRLLALLEEIAGQSPSADTAEAALQLLRKQAQARLATLVPILLRADAGAITLPTVAGYLHRHRQDLLTPFLRRRRYGGRFSTGRAPFLPAFAGRFSRWTAAQQARYANALGTLINDPAADAPAVLAAIRRLAALPANTPSQLLALAAESAEGRLLTVTAPRIGAVTPGIPPRRRTIARRDASLRALGRLDGGQGLDALREAARDERAGVAVGALRAAVLAMPPSQALALLQAIPLDRVRVAKEVVRLLGDLEDAAAYRALLDLAARSLHRDVYLALLRGLAVHPDHEETWTVLEQAARSLDPALAVAAGRMPAARLSVRAQSRLLDLLILLLARPEPEVRAGALARCRDLPVADPDRRLVAPLLTALASDVPGEAQVAAAAFLGLYTAEDLPAIEDAARRLRTQRRSLEALVAAVRLEVSVSRRVHSAAARAVLAGLAGDPLLTELRTRLAAETLQGDELARWLEEAVAAGDFHVGAFGIALGTLGSYGGAAQGLAFAYLARLGVGLHRLRRNRQPAWVRGTQRDGPALERLEACLADHPDDRLRRIALAALVEQGDDSRGWEAERLARLRRFAADRAPLVAETAQSELAQVEDARRLRGP